MNTQQFLAEFVDGGPGCSRDDCTVRPENQTFNTIIVRCTSCGKSWEQPLGTPIGKKEDL